jgi:hypothetical protein
MDARLFRALGVFTRRDMGMPCAEAVVLRSEGLERSQETVAFDDDVAEVSEFLFPAGVEFGEVADARREDALAPAELADLEFQRGHPCLEVIAAALEGVFAVGLGLGAGRRVGFGPGGAAKGEQGGGEDGRFGSHEPSIPRSVSLRRVCWRA